MRGLIGGVHGLVTVDPQGSPAPFSHHFARSLRTANARGALRFLVARTAPRLVWMPAYLCEVMVLELGAPVRYYPVGEGLRATSGPWCEEVDGSDIVLSIAWFGWRPDPVPLKVAAAVGATRVVDASQALLTEGLEDNADWIIYSPRKFVGVPDGGLLVPIAPAVDLSGVILPPVPRDWARVAWRAALERALWDAAGVEGAPRAWFDAFRIHDHTAPEGVHAMSPYAEALLNGGLDLSAIAVRRRANAAQLMAALGPWLVFPSLAPGEVPLGVPVLLPSPASRAAVQAALFAQNIYPAVHWPIEGLVPASFAWSHEFGGRVLTLISDQRVDSDGIARTIRIFQSVMRGFR